MSPMAEPATKQMTLDEFLRWDDGANTRYELIRGFPVAVVPPAVTHRMLAMRLVTRIDFSLANRRPFNVKLNAGVIPPHCGETFFVADIAALSATPRQPAYAEEFRLPGRVRSIHRISKWRRMTECREMSPTARRRTR